MLIPNPGGCRKICRPYLICRVNSPRASFPLAELDNVALARLGARICQLATGPRIHLHQIRLDFGLTSAEKLDVVSSAPARRPNSGLGARATNCRPCTTFVASH